MADIQEYKCPCCGGAIAFDSTLQKMKCPYCDNEFDMETLLAYDSDLNSTSEEDKIKWETPGQVWQEGDTEGMREYACKSCGGRIIGDANLGATACPYCGNPVVMMGQFTGDLKPDKIIPFKLDKEAAKAALKAHYKKPFTPNSFFTGNHIDEIKGVYVPFWLYDTDSHGRARYKATQVRTWADPMYMYTETRFFSVYREGDISFQKIPADGSSSMDNTLMESIEPYDYSEAVDFQTAYMAGYLADKYDIDAEANNERVTARVKNSTIEALNETVSGYASAQMEASSIKSENGKITYAMYPVWLLNTMWNGQKYTFAMNGQTGKMVGDIPVSGGKVFGKFAMFAAIIAAAAFLIQFLMNQQIYAGKIIISLVIGIVIGGIIVLIMRGQHRSVLAQFEADRYAQQGGLSLTGHKDTYLYSTVMKTPIAQKNMQAAQAGAAGHVQQVNLQQAARPQQQIRPQQQAARPVQQIRPQQQAARPVQQIRPQQQAARPGQQVRPVQPIKPSQVRPPQRPNNGQ